MFCYFASCIKLTHNVNLTYDFTKILFDLIKIRIVEVYRGLHVMANVYFTYPSLVDRIISSTLPMYKNILIDVPSLSYLEIVAHRKLVSKLWIN